MNCPHNGTHTRTLACYGITSDPVDPNNGFGDNDARTHFEDQCNNKDWGDWGSYTCKGLKQYLKDGSVCQYRNGMGSKDNSEYFYFLYFGGQYYEITESQYNNWKTNTGKSVNHGNDTYCVYEGKTTCMHIHTDSCYNCGKVEHTHSETCRNIGMDTDLWKYVRSDRIEVAADGSTIINVYYDRVPKTLTFKYDYGYGYRKTETITAKWGQNISEQYLAVRNTTNSNLWSADVSGDGPWTGYFGVMPEKSATYYTRSGMGSGGYMRYYGESLTSDDYSIELLLDPVSSSNTVTDEDRYEFQGFTYDHGSKNGSYCTSAKFYYKRNTYGLVFNNGEEVLERYSVKYQAPLGQYDFVPTKAPSWYESGSVQFAGWYLNPQCTGDKYVLSEHTMPVGAKNGDNALILYAHWVPVTHTVTTYLTEDAVEKDAPLKTESVEHNKFATAPTDVDNGNYEFVGWFYMDNGVEKAFDFENMPVKKDLTIYGKWRANSMVDFVIHYQLENGTPVAEDRVGKALAESTQTFDAKIGNDLSQGYREGYFPKVASHSMFMNIAGTNEYTFVYVKLPSVNYTVKYLEKGTNNVLKEEKHASTSSAVITERFERIPGYRPDAYQKRLVLSADESENVLIFYYTVDNEHADVTETHYIQNLDGSYSVYRSTTDLNGVIDDSYDASVLDIPGFRFEKSTVNGVDRTPTAGKLTETLTNAGLTFEFYYVRNKYPYTFKFLEQGTNKELATEVKGTELYGKDVTQNSLNIPGYTCVSGDVQRITIDVDEDNNVAIFYYTEQEVTINYVAVGPDGKQFGSVAPGSEKVKVLTGTPGGSTPTANDDFRFVGWFKDENCTQPVPADWVDANKLTPGKTVKYGEKDGYEAATYYAKFEPDVADLTITKTGCANIDEHQSFIFTVTGGDLPDEGLKVVVKGNGSVTIKGLKVGTTYTITEDTGWSWRYTPKTEDGKTDQPAQDIELRAEVNGYENIVTFNNFRTQDKWLNGCSWAENNWAFGKKKTDKNPNGETN